MALDQLFEVALTSYLAARGLTDEDALAPGWYTGLLPDRDPAVPDFAVCVIPEAGLQPTNVLGTKPQVTVRVRHPSARKANLFLLKVFRELQEFSSPNLAGSGVGVARIFAAQGPVQIGRDDGPGQGRWIVQQTFQAIVASY